MLGKENGLPSMTALHNRIITARPAWDCGAARLKQVCMMLSAGSAALLRDYVPGELCSSSAKVLCGAAGCSSLTVAARHPLLWQAEPQKINLEGDACCA